MPYDNFPVLAAPPSQDKNLDRSDDPTDKLRQESEQILQYPELQVAIEVYQRLHTKYQQRPDEMSAAERREYLGYINAFLAQPVAFLRLQHPEMKSIDLLQEVKPEVLRVRQVKNELLAAIHNDELDHKRHLPRVEPDLGPFEKKLGAKVEKILYEASVKWITDRQKPLPDQWQRAPSTTRYHEIVESQPDPTRPRYALSEKVLGSGASAAIRLGWDMKLDRPVVIKALKPDDSDQMVLERFEQEARTMARTLATNNSEQVIKVYDLLIQDDQAYMVMEYMDPKESPTLSSVRESMSSEQSIQVLQQLATAIDSLAHQGILHADLKPANIFLKDFFVSEAKSHNPNFVVKLGDFGLAKWSNYPDSRRNRELGTPRYAAPELHTPLGQEIPNSVESEVFSLGMIAYELLSKKILFQEMNWNFGAQPNLLFGYYKRMDFKLDEHQSLKENLKSIGADLDRCQAVFARVFRPKPEERYHSASEFITALVRAIRNEPEEPQQKGLASFLASLRKIFSKR